MEGGQKVPYFFLIIEKREKFVLWERRIHE